MAEEWVLMAFADALFRRQAQIPGLPNSVQPEARIGQLIGPPEVSRLVPWAQVLCRVN